MKTNLTSVDFEQTPVNQSKLIDNFEKMKKMSGRGLVLGHEWFPGKSSYELVTHC